jgi:cell division protease FtsH
LNNRPPEPPHGNRKPDDDPSKKRPTTDGDPPPNQNAQRNWLIVAGLFVFLLIFTFANSGRSSSNYPISQLVADLRAGRVEKIVQQGSNRIIVEMRGGNTISANIAPGSDISSTLAQDYGLSTEEIVRANIMYDQEDTTGPFIFNILVIALPMVLIVWLLFRMMRSARGQQDQAMSFGRSRARVLRDMERPQVTFSDVAGADEAKEELQEVVEFLRDHDKFIRLGARVPKGVLMVGPPGTGKTLMARAVAGEAGVPFFSISGSEFVEMFVGVGASRVRDLFDRAKAEAPAIIFIDEIDAVGRHRGAGLGGGHDEREQTLNQILVEMDGFETGTNIIIIAATNRPDILDPALMRPGRFDRKVIMDAPDIKGREDILKVHARGKPLSRDVDLNALAKITPGFSGADLENLINEAAILAARRNLKTIGMSEMQESMERVIMGPERKSRIIGEKEKRWIAYHEGGHAVVRYYLPRLDAVHKITIIPRGRAGGYVLSLPETDTQLLPKEYFEDAIATALGGRAAEELIFNQFTTGASNDLQQATRMARAMVTEYGMSSDLGPRSYGGSGSQSVFLGREIGEQRDYSERYAQIIDDEVKRILDHNYERALDLLRENRDKLEQLVEYLIEHETLDRAQFEALMEQPLPSGEAQ